MTNRNNKFTAPMSAPRGHYECKYVEDDPVSDPSGADNPHPESCQCEAVPATPADVVSGPGGSLGAFTIVIGPADNDDDDGQD